MPESQVLFQSNGPLPPVLAIPFNSDVSGDATIFISGSAMRKTRGQMGITLSLDGTDAGELLVYTNDAQSHKTMVGVFWAVNLTVGQHTITLKPQQGTMTNADDYFIVTLID